jgi:hypothetical protein
MEPERQRSGMAIGFTMFAAVMMIIMGFFHAFAGLAALFNDEQFVVTKDYLFKVDVTGWGWIHLILGIVVVLAGFALLTGAVWARTVGVLVAGISAIANFAYLPVYPVWAVIIIAVDITVIWALTAHGRDIAA